MDPAGAMPSRVAMPRRVTASGPDSASSARAVSRISASVASRRCARRVGGVNEGTGQY